MERRLGVTPGKTGTTGVRKKTGIQGVPRSFPSVFDVSLQGGTGEEGGREVVLRHARRIGEWTGRVRRNCSLSPPRYFSSSHRVWFEAARTPPPDVYLTFEDVVFRRNESLSKVEKACLDKDFFRGTRRPPGQVQGEDEGRRSSF